MTHPMNALTQADVLQLAPAALRTSDLDGTAIDVGAYEGMALAVLNAGAATAGSSPTLSVKLQHSDTQGGTYTDITGGAFTQVTASASLQELNVNLANVKRWIKAVGTLGGTSTPTFPYSVSIAAIKKAP